MSEYQAIVVTGDSASSQRKYPYVLVVAVFAGAVLTALGAAQSTVSMYSAVQTSTSTRIGSTIQPLRANPVISSHSSQDVDPAYIETAEYVPQSTSASFGFQQGGIAVAIGMVLGAVGAYLFKSKKEWSMAALAMESQDDGMPSILEVVAARQEFMRLQGKGPGPSLAPGEILRPVSFPGKSEPVDLVEMYKQFEELLGDNVRNPATGTRVVGTVFDVDDRGASVDFGGKTIGYCPTEELALSKVKRAPDVVMVGEQREFDIVAPNMGRRKDEDEMTLLSMKTIQEEIAWKRLQQYRENDVTFSVVLKGKNRGGYMMEVEDLAVPGFLPKSQATSDLATAPENADPSTFMDQVVEVKVLDLDPERRRLVVSQRAANPKMTADTFKVGTVHEGIVQNVKPYGVFVDVNGMSGLLHISQISHNRIDNVESIFQVGDKIKCMVLSQDQVQGRLALSTKRLEPTHGDMLTNPQLVYEKAEEMAERFREDIAAAEKRMQEFEAKLAEQNTVAFG